MNTTAVLAEIVITGLVTLIGIFLLILGAGESNNELPIFDPGLSDVIIGLAVLGLSYLVGNFVNVISHLVFNKVDKYYRTAKLKSLDYQKTRLKIYKYSEEFKSFLDTRYSILRLFRSSSISFIILGIGFLVYNPTFLSQQQFFLVASLISLMFLLSILFYINQTKVFYKIIFNMNEVMRDTPPPPNKTD